MVFRHAIATMCVVLGVSWLLLRSSVATGPHALSVAEMNVEVGGVIGEIKECVGTIEWTYCSRERVLCPTTGDQFVCENSDWKNRCAPEDGVKESGTGTSGMQEINCATYEDGDCVWATLDGDPTEGKVCEPGAAHVHDKPHTCGTKWEDCIPAG